MEEARSIQAPLLPSGPLRGPNFEIAWRFSPFSGVRGDFADYFGLPNGLVGIGLGDVTGKGFPAGAAQQEDITVVVNALATITLPRPGGGFSRTAIC